MIVYDVVPRADAARKVCRVIRTRWVSANKGTDDQRQLRVRWHRSFAAEEETKRVLACNTCFQGDRVAAVFV